MKVHIRTIRHRHPEIRSISYPSKDRKISWIQSDPTGNCQIMSIVRADSLFEIGLRDAKNNLDTFAEIWNNYGKNITMLDVHEEFKADIHGVWGKENIILEKKYTSTNGSKMILFLLDNVPLETYCASEEFQSRNNKIAL